MNAVYTPTRYKLSVEDYHRLGEVGILNEDSRVELVEGELIATAPIGGQHLRTVVCLNRLLVQAIGDRADVFPQRSVLLPPDSEPQPDFAVLRAAVGVEAVQVSQAPEVLLVVEVSDTTLRYDRGTKLRLYARHGIPEVWIVDINAMRVECYRDPSDASYRTKAFRQRGIDVDILHLPGVRIAVSEVFGAD